MRSLRGTATVLLLVAIVAVAAALPAGAVPPHPSIKVAKHADGPFSGAVVPVTVQRRKDLYVRIANTTDEAQDVALFQNAMGPNPDFSVRWFKGDTDVSHDVQTSGHSFVLRPDRPKLFRARVKPLIDTPGSLCLLPRIEYSGGLAIYGGRFAINGTGACE